MLHAGARGKCQDFRIAISFWTQTKKKDVDAHLSFTLGDKGVQLLIDEFHALRNLTLVGQEVAQPFHLPVGIW
jgi:hypothetical protein